MKNLVVVESPAKAKTIGKILGKEYQVTSCYGHIRDLAKAKMGVDIKNHYKPSYVVSEDKKKLVAELKKLAKKAESIWLATDEDREGEAISWHLCELLGLNPAETKRIVFHEITKTAVQRAIEHPRTINQDLVNAQQARRILDRLVGFHLSPILIRKIPNSGSLSAGRVQSIAVRLIVERERANQDHESKISYTPQAHFSVASQGDSSKHQLVKSQGKTYTDVEDVVALLNRLKDDTFVVEDVQKKQGVRRPSAPFTTSTMQQEAVRKLGYGVSRTMLIAQKLYEAGLITYMRTDSVNLSQDSLGKIKKHIAKSYGETYHRTRQFATKTKLAQEAHEAIRPTDITQEYIKETSNQALYDLIRKRTLASQMSDAQTERTVINIVSVKRRDTFKAKGEVILFDGFLKAYQEGYDEEHTDQEESRLLPKVEQGQPLTLVTVEVKPKHSKSEPRYSEATLVKKLEELGIGRPSTYAPTIVTVQKRGYVIKKTAEPKSRQIKVYRLEQGMVSITEESESYGVDKNKLFPSDLGVIVNDFLVDHFNRVMDYHFTAQLEEQFDAVASGNEEWFKVIDSFFVPFKETIGDVEKTASRVSGERKLGVHPETKKQITVRMGRYGPMVQMGDSESEEKPKYAKLLPTQKLSTVSLDEAILLLSLPKTIGETPEGETVVINQGPFGPYIRYNQKFYSIPKTDDLFGVSMQRALELIKEKDSRDANRLVKDFPEQGIQLLNGRYGVYIKAGKKNYKIPKAILKKNVATLSLEEVQKIIKEQDENPTKARRGRRKKEG